MTMVLKLGGSVITEKDNPETVAEERLSRVADILAGQGDLVVVHGGGSFGHHYANAHGITMSEGTPDAAAVRDVHGAMKRLNGAVVGELADHGTPAVPIHPFSAMYRSPDDNRTVLLGQVAALCSEGFVPVLHGDVVAHRGRGATVVSGDELVVVLADGLGAERVGLCSSVPGVLNANSEVVGHVDDYEAVADTLGGSEATDVTGGMAEKVRELLRLNAPAYIFDLDGLQEFVDGGSPGTLVD